MIVMETSMTHQKRVHVRKANFSDDELMWFVNIFENTWAVICDPSKTADTNRKKRLMWHKIQKEHTTRFPDLSRTIDEMKNKLLKLKCEAKAEWAKGKISLEAPNSAPTEHQEMTITQYVHKKILRLCQLYEPETLASLQIPDQSLSQQSPDTSISTNTPVNAGLPTNIKIEYVVDDDSSVSEVLSEKDALTEPWEQLPPFHIPATTTRDGTHLVSSQMSVSSSSTAGSRPSIPLDSEHDRTSLSSHNREASYLPFVSCDDDDVEAITHVSMTTHSMPRPPSTLESPALPRQSSLITSYPLEMSSSLQVSSSFNSNSQSQSNRWSYPVEQSKVAFAEPGVAHGRDQPINVSAQCFPFSGRQNNSAVPPTSGHTSTNRTLPNISHEISPSSSPHSSFNGCLPTINKTFPVYQQSHISAMQREEKISSLCNPSAAAAENGCSSPEENLLHSDALHKRMRLASHQQLVKDEVLEIERSNLLIKRENLLLKQEKLRLEIQLLKKQV